MQNQDTNEKQSCFVREKMEELFERFKKSPLDEYFAKHGDSIPAKRKMFQAMQVVGVAYGVSVGIMMYLTMIFVIYPVAYEGLAEEHTRMWWISLFIMLNLYLNYYLTYSTSSTYKPEGLPTTAEDPTWNLCYACSLKKPPRAHHCPLCGYCILKRDHHCFFTACCIGFNNQRYFIMLNFYVALGAMISFYFCTHYLYLEFEPVMSWNFYRYILPVTFVQWITGNTPFIVFHIVIVMSLAFMTALGTACFFLWQIFIIIRGVTTHEFFKGNAHHRTSIMEGFRSVFGPFWLLNFILPMPWLKSTHDGIHWRNLKNI